MDPILIHRGDCTIFADCKKFLTFNIATELNLFGWSAKFVLGYVTKEIADITSKSFEVILSAEDTAKLRYGLTHGAIILTDDQGNIKTICNDIPFEITSKVVENEHQEIDLTIPESSGIDITLKVGSDIVTAVNGLTGNVVLTAEDVGALSSDTEIPSIEGLATEEQLNDKANDVDVVHRTGVETIADSKTFTAPLTIQNGSGTGCLIVGADVNSSDLTNNTRKLARISIPTEADYTLGATLLGFDSSGDFNLNLTNKNIDAVSFGGQKKITNATSPMNIGFCVTKTRYSLASSDKVYPLEMDAYQARFNVPPNYQGANLVTENVLTQYAKVSDPMTEEAYNALEIKDAKTLYLIEE